MSVSIKKEMGSCTSTPAASTSTPVEIIADPKAKKTASPPPQQPPPPKSNQAAKTNETTEEAVSEVNLTLLRACKSNDLVTATSCLDDPNCDMNVRGMWGNTPLLAATMYGGWDVVSLLLERGADVALRDEKNVGPLTHSCLSGNTDAVSKILSNSGSESCFTEEVS